LAGPSADLDPRFDAFRPDLADAALADRLFAPHYAEPVSRNAGSDGAALYEAASRSAEAVAQLEPNEAFALLDITGDWAWGYRASDHRVGFVPASQLAPLQG
jgi:hypothetical protein